MGAVRKLVIEVSEENADRIEEMVRTGEFASADDVVGAALDALRPTDAEFDDWVRREAVPVMERMKTHPETALTMEQVRTHIRDLHERALKGDL